MKSRSRVSRWCLAVAVALISACSSAASSPSQDQGAGPAPAPRQPSLRPCPAPGSGSSLPTLRLPCLTGTATVNLAALGGRPLLVNLWASWCVPCQEEMPSLQKAYAATTGHLSFLGVDTKDDLSSAQDFLAATGIHYPQVRDAGADLLHRLGSAGLPVTLVLDGRGKIVYSHRGALRAKDLTAALRAGGWQT